MRWQRFLRRLLHQLPCRDALMQEYDDKWHQDGLVMDKWFILQATSRAANVLETVRGLLQHRSFTMSNPNRIRSIWCVCEQQPGSVPCRRWERLPVPGGNAYRPEQP